MRSASLPAQLMPILADTTVETSIDPDKSVGELQVTKKPNFSKSVFEITTKDLENHRASNELKDFEARLCQEIKDWKIHITKALAELKEAKKKHPVIDWTILPKEKREFIENAPDFSRFLRGMHEFRCDAVTFLENDYPEILTIQENLIELCKEKLNIKRESFLEQRIANSKDAVL